MDARKNGWVLETSELKPFAGGGVEAELNRFADVVLARCKVEARLDPAHPRLRFTSLTGHTLDLTFRPHSAPYTDQSKVDGEAIDYSSWPTLSNPWVRQDRGSPVLQIRYGGKLFTYNFVKWSREQR